MPVPTSQQGTLIHKNLYCSKENLTNHVSVRENPRKSLF